MARKSRKSKQSPQRTGSGLLSRLHLSDNEYIGVVAIVALFLIAAIVLKGPALLRDDAPLAGQAFLPPAPESPGMNHAPPMYVAPEGWDEAEVAAGEESV